jgi:hypothetical protein
MKKIIIDKCLTPEARSRKPLLIIFSFTLSLLLYSNPSVLFSQTVYYYTSNQELDSFIDELANSQIIDLNSSVKPYSRLFIGQKLKEVEEKKDMLNPRQAREVEFYLKDFNKELVADKNFNKRFDLLYRKDSLFTLSVNPILGIQFWTNKNGTIYHRWNGAEAFAYIGKHWGFYASLRDNYEKEQLEKPEYLTLRPGAAYKSETDYSEMRGGITYGWKWGTLALVKDHFTWGDNNHGSNIFSGRTPSFAQIKLSLKPVDWFEFNYIHGFLVSEVIDSTRTWYYTNVNQTQERKAYREKYMAANFFTFRPWKRIYVSFGNSIVYSDIGFEPAYLIPLFFFKSVDHTLNHEIDNQNSQMFFSVSSRQIKNLHLYSSLFVDEISIANMFNKEKHSNFLSWKIGGQLTNLPFQNLSLVAEYTRTNPLVYQHFVPTLTFESNRFNLGHYLKDNADELYLAIGMRPIRGLSIDLSYLHARKGPDYDSETTQRTGLPFMNTVEWENHTFSLNIRYQVINDGYAFLEFSSGNITGNVEKYTPPILRGKTTTLSAGANIGF